jgi:hypothetical protein
MRKLVFISILIIFSLILASSVYALSPFDILSWFFNFFGKITGYVTYEGTPDLTIIDVNFEPTYPTINAMVKTNATVKNIGTANASFSVELYVTDKVVGKRLIGNQWFYNVAPGQIVFFNLTFQIYSDSEINITADGWNTVIESNEYNNQLIKIVNVIPCGNGICDTGEGEDIINCPQDCCESDCTAKYDSICYSRCNNFNTCSFFNSIVASACDANQINTKIVYNSTHTVTCCEGSPQTTCGNEICEPGETSIVSYGQVTTCPEDCGYEIDPYYADVDYCISSDGVIFSTTKPPSAPWFIWGNCAREKYYNVIKGEKLRLHVYTDACPGCVCYYPDFDIYEYQNNSWILSKSFDLPNVKGLYQNEYYIPNSDKIKVVAKNCFYLDIFSYKNITTTCLHSPPKVTVTPISQFGLAGSTLQYNTTVKNMDSIACSPRKFSISYSYPNNPPGWNITFLDKPCIFGLNCFDYFQLNPQELKSFAFIVTSPPSTPAATYTMHIAASGDLGAQDYSGPFNYSYIVLSAVSTNATITSFSCNAIGSLKAQCTVGTKNLDTSKKYYVYVAGSGKTNNKPAAGATTIYGGDTSATVVVLTLLVDTYQLGAWVFEGTNPDVIRPALTFWRGSPVEIYIS